MCAAWMRRGCGVGAAAHRAWREAGEAAERAEGRVDIGSGGAEAREAAVERRGEHLEAHAEGRAQLLERGRGAGRLHAAAALIAALQREQSCQAAVGGSQKRAQPPRRPCALGLRLPRLLLLLPLLLLLAAVHEQHGVRVGHVELKVEIEHGHQRHQWHQHQP